MLFATAFFGPKSAGGLRVDETVREAFASIEFGAPQQAPLASSPSEASKKKWACRRCAELDFEFR